MKKLSLNSAGFGAIELLSIVVIIGLLGFVGWYVYSQKSKNNSQTTSIPTTTRQTTIAEQEKALLSQEYLEIKEWSVRFKLNADAKDSYYKMREDGKYADVFNSNFDTLKNKKGEQCKDELIFVVARYSENDPRLEDPTNSKPESYIKGYGYTGTPAHQAPPRCSLVNDDPSANAEFDDNVLGAFTKYKKALTESFKTLEVI